MELHHYQIGSILSEKEIALIKQEYEKVAAYQRSDPSACLTTSRRIAEDICKQLVVRELAEDASGVMLNKLINKLSEKKILPYYVAVPLRTIQNYGNLGAHAQGKDAVHITSEFVQPCIQSLSKVVDWYLHTYRPVKAVVFTARKTDRKQIENAGAQLRPDLKIAYPQDKKDMGADDLLKMCQSYADSLQNLACIFLFPHDTPQYIREAVSEAGKAFKAWGNRVFSLLLPETADFADIETFKPLLMIFETIIHIESQTPIERQRRIDAAVPETSKIDQHVDLLVQIRFPHSPILGIEEWPARQKPQALESDSGEINVKFPVDQQTGTIQSAYLWIKVNAPDCIVCGEAQKRIEIPPEDFSQVITFLLTPKKEGLSRIQVEVYNDERTYLGTVRVKMLVIAARNAADGSHAGMNASSLVLFADKSNGRDTSQGSPQTPLQNSAYPSASHQSVFVKDIERMMKLNASFLMTQKNQGIAAQVCEEILWSLDPQQAESDIPFILPLVGKYARGEIKPVGSADVPGGFGIPGEAGAKLSVKIIVPVVIFLLKFLLSEEQQKPWHRLTRWMQRDSVYFDSSKISAIQSLTEVDMQHILDALGITLAQEDLRKLTQIVKTVISNYNFSEK